MKKLLIFLLAVTVYSCAEDDLGIKTAPYSFSLHRNGTTEFIQEMTPVAWSSQEIIGKEVNYTVSSTEDEIAGVSLGIEFNIPYQFTGVFEK